MNRVEIIKLIDSFIDGSLSDDHAWDDFVSGWEGGSEHEAIRAKIHQIERQYPAKKQWCSDEGIAALEELSVKLKQEHW